MSDRFITIVKELKEPQNVMIENEYDVLLTTSPSLFKRRTTG
ncbi:MAG: hypothetical protein P8Z35_20565 [Ignavibacteriaceae bacterium]